MTFRAAFTSGSSKLSNAKAWNNEIEEAMSIEDVRTSKSITGQNLVDFEYLDMKIANGLMKIISGGLQEKSRHRTRNCTKAEASSNWPSNGMFYEFFKVSETTSQKHMEILQVELKVDSVQAFNANWHETVIARKNRRRDPEKSVRQTIGEV